MIRATFRKLLRAVTGSGPHTPPAPHPHVPDLSRFVPPKAARTGGTNRYVPIPGHGPGAAARRLRARDRAAR